MRKNTIEKEVIARREILLKDQQFFVKAKREEGVEKAEKKDAVSRAPARLPSVKKKRRKKDSEGGKAERDLEQVAI